MSEQKSDVTMDQGFIVFFRLTMGWTFLWAGIHQDVYKRQASRRALSEKFR